MASPKCAWCNKRNRTCRVSHKETGRASSYCCDDPKCLAKAKDHVGAQWHDEWEIVPMPAKAKPFPEPNLGLIAS